MTNKIISTVILAVCFPVMALTPNHPASLLFIFISGNKFVATARLALAMVMFAFSFGYVMLNLNDKLRRNLIISGAVTIFFGLAALLATSFGSFLYDYLKIMDIMIILELGILQIAVAVEKPAPAYQVKSSRQQAKKRSSKPSVATA